MSVAGSGRALRVAIVGAGLMGRWHARYARRAGADIAAIVDSDAEAARRLRARHPSAATFRDLTAMLAGDPPDIAHVCTPTGTHAEIARRLLSGGMHVLVEKPLAASVEETSDLMREADAHGVLVCPVYQFPFQRGFERARERLKSMGRPVRAEFIICSSGGERLSGGDRKSVV